jgi:hypothetical protein
MSLNTSVLRLRWIADTYGYYSGLFNLISGLLGNSFICFLFIKVKLYRGNQSSFYFIAESLSNLALLLTIYSSRFHQAIFGFDPILFSIYWCKIRSMLAQRFGIFSLFIICFSTFDQYLSTHHRYSFRQLSSMNLARRLTLISCLIMLIHSFLFLIFAEIHPTMGCNVFDHHVRRYYSFFYYPVLSTALPFLMTISLSLLAFRNVRRIIRRQLPIYRRRLDQQMTALVVARVISIVVCGLPFILITLYQLNMGHVDQHSFHWNLVMLIGAVFYSLLYTNFSVKNDRWHHVVPHRSVRFRSISTFFSSFQIDFVVK